MIRYRDKSQYYPVLYSLFGLSVLAVFYYVFQADLPTVNGEPCIGWHCRSGLAGGLGWAILGIALTTFVAFGIFIAAMQIVAQLSVEAGMSLQEKRWKEWKWGLALVLIGVSASGIGREFNASFGGWALVVTALVAVAFVVFKVVRDAVNCGSLPWALLIGLAWLVGVAASVALMLEVIHACVYLVIFLAAFFAQAKARKKKVAKR